MTLDDLLAALQSARSPTLSTEEFLQKQLVFYAEGYGLGVSLALKRVWYSPLEDSINLTFKEDLGS